jgi:hypothetical protein
MTIKMILLILGTMSRYKYKIRAELSGKKTILRERVIELGHFGFDPDSSSPDSGLPGALFRSKMPNREVVELQLPLLGVQP